MLWRECSFKHWKKFEEKIKNDIQKCPKSIRLYLVNRIALYIISVQGARNCDKLQAELVRNFGVEPKVLWGTTPQNLPCFSSDLHMHPGRSRSMSCREVAAATSHSRARTIAYTEGADWNIFLEDDSEFIQINFPNFLSNLARLPEERGVFIHLFPEQNGVLAISDFIGMYSIKKNPDYANAYALNREALRILIKNSKDDYLSLADWPDFPRRILRLATTQSIFRHPFESHSSSLIATGRLELQGKKSSFRIKYRSKQLAFKFIRRFFAKYGFEKIESEGLRSIVWK